MPNIKAAKTAKQSVRKDINFFALRKVKRKGLDVTIPPWLISIVIPAIFVAVITSVYIYNQSTISRLQKELASSQLQIENANVERQRPYMAQKQVEFDIFDTYYGWVSSLNAQFYDYKTVQSDIPIALTEAASGLIDIESVAFADGNVVIKATARDMRAIAEYQEKCSRIPDMTDSFVSDIRRSADVDKYHWDNNGQNAPTEYTFTFNGMFTPRNKMQKGGESNGQQ